MLIWINGTFGAGKSTTAQLVRDAIPGTRLFDPEYVGYLLREFVEVPTGDFQDLRLWRTLTVQALTGLVGEYGGDWVVPMTLLNRGYRTEILGGLRAGRVPVLHCVLVVPEEELRSRIDGDTSLPDQARAWRHRHVALAASELPGIAAREADTVEIDGIMSPAAVTEAVLAAVAAHREPAVRG